MADPRSNSAIVLLGTGTPIADPDRFGPAVAIVVQDVPYLFDCGPGVVRRAAAAHRAGTAGLEVTRLDRVFLTHLHSDHTAGLPDLLLSPWVLGRRRPLEVFGPEGTRSMAEHLLAAYEADIRLRLEGLEPANDQGWKAEAQEIIATGQVYRDDRVTVEAFPVRHGPWPAFGYRVTTPNRVIVISGDTAPTAELITRGLGCDVLIHEVYSLAGFATQRSGWQTYHREMHTSSREVAAIAARVGPGLLLLYHQLFWGASEQDLLAEVRAHYSGPVASGRDLEIY